VWRWWTTDPERVSQKPSLTSYFMDEKTALERHPDARRHEPSRKLQTVYERGEDPPANSKPGAGRQ
jgi:hypothetical protein